ncbi:MAG: DegT/DnrJ/EryC1/StrS family aminotransferase [Thermosynechococcaceae cyanobacterium MS004]|nr:DegT/DnrJ/EryC1/StrS family aminotransferase [Thermosynechococcaceae cyanobacterium MS004]
MSYKDRFLMGEPAIEEPEIEKVIDCLYSECLETGSKIARFEDNFRQYKDAQYSIGVNSCTTGLRLSTLITDIQTWDEAITMPITFCATVNAIRHADAKPIFLDVDPHIANINPNLIEAAITSKAKADLLVHFAGRPCEMDDIINITKRHNLKLIGDCAHVIKTEYKDCKEDT